jgi:hypothetical protein
VQPGWARQVACVVSTVHGVTLPWQTDDVCCHEQPRCSEQAFWVVSAVHPVSVPVQGVAVADHEHPGVVQVVGSVPAHVGVPVQLLALKVQPYCAWQAL